MVIETANIKIFFIVEVLYCKVHAGKKFSRSGHARFGFERTSKFQLYHRQI